MALGGGTFITQNKKLPGAYINFVSVSSASATLSDRGIAAMGFELDWGAEGKIFEVTNEDFQKRSMEIFGYAYTDEHLKDLRDLFLNTRLLYAYRLNGGGVKASNDFAEALHGGIRGNDIKIVIQVNVDEENKFDVKTILGTYVVDEQTVGSAAELVENAYVKFKTGATLTETAGTPLAGGTNGTVSGESHQAFLDKIEAYSYNAMGVTSTDETIKGMYTAFNRRLRDEMGVKFQLVVYRRAADYLGVVNVKNKVLDEGANEAGLVCWTTGALAGCPVNQSLQNSIYTGEFEVDTEYTQSQLIEAIDAGEFVFHRVGTEVRVLEDINSMVTTSETQGDVFKDNQTIRVIDQIANDIAVLFNTRYLGAIPNDAAGRSALWSDIVKHHRQLEDIRAIEGFNGADVVVERGDSKKSVVVSDVVEPVNAMGKLYMTVMVE